MQRNKEPEICVCRVSHNTETPMLIARSAKGGEWKREREKVTSATVNQ